MLGRTMLGKLPLVSTSFANLPIGESLEAAFYHVPPKIYRICFSIWMSPIMGAAEANQAKRSLRPATKYDRKGSLALLAQRALTALCVFIPRQQTEGARFALAR